jgi:hypothetical protein
VTGPPLTWHAAPLPVGLIPLHPGDIALRSAIHKQCEQICPQFGSKLKRQGLSAKMAPSPVGLLLTNVQLSPVPLAKRDGGVVVSGKS